MKRMKRPEEEEIMTDCNRSYWRLSANSVLFKVEKEMGT